MGEVKPIAVGALHQEEHDRPVPLRNHGFELSQMFGAACGDAVGKLCKPGLAAQRDAFHFNIGIGQTRSAEQEINPAVFPIPDLGADSLIAGQWRNLALLQCRAQRPVRHRGIDSGKVAVLMIDKAPAEFQFLFRIVIRLKPDLHSGLGQSHHRPGIGAMGGYFAAIGQLAIRKEPLVAAQQTSGDKRGWKAHEARPIPAEDAMQGVLTQEHLMTNPTAAMLVIGDEILSGRTRDANMYHLAGELSTHGIDLKEVRVVSDDRQAIVDAVRALSDAYTHVFTSGGIGPTHDDITADSIAAAFGVPIDVREDARSILEAHYRSSGQSLNAARLRMARIPDGAQLIDNPVSAAPGFSLGNVHVMAGVPSIFCAMVASVLPGMTGGTPLMSQTLRIDRPEGEIAGPLAGLAEAFTDLSIGCYPFQKNGALGAQIVIRGHDGAQINAAVAQLNTLLGQAE